MVAAAVGLAACSGLAACGGSASTASTASTSPAPSASGASAAPASTAPGASRGSGDSSSAPSSSVLPNGIGAAEYAGGPATVEVEASSGVLTWSGTLTGECAPNPFAGFPVDIRATNAEGVRFEGHPSLPAAGTFHSEDDSSIPRFDGTVLDFPKGTPQNGSVTDPKYTVTYDDDLARSGTVVLERFRYPTTKQNDGIVTITWTCG